MIELANKNIQEAGVHNASFIQASITSIPLPNSSVDCIISNCVINLVPAKDKPLVFQEIARLLKPGGRLAISDILARKKLPENIVNDMSLYVGCIAGASRVAEYEDYLKSAGFQGTVVLSVARMFLYTDCLSLDVLIIDTKGNLNIYNESSSLTESSCCSSGKSASNESANDHLDIDFNEWAGQSTSYEF
jgi:arsenite methyltransferase